MSDTTVPAELFQEPLPILRFTIQFPWAMKSGNSAKFAEKHEVRKACSRQIEKAVKAIYGAESSNSSQNGDEGNQAIAAFAGIAMAIKSYLNNPQHPLSKLDAAVKARKEAEALQAAAVEALQAAAVEALKEAVEALQAAGEKLQAAGEKLQAAGEKLQAAGEALKAAGEALKAEAEALQKANATTAEALQAAAEALQKANATTAEALQAAGEKLQAAAAFGSATAAASGNASDISGVRDALLNAAKLAASVQKVDGNGGDSKQTPGESLVRTRLHINVGTSAKRVPIDVDVEWPVLVKKKALCLVDLDVEIATKKPGWALASGLVESPDQQGSDLDNLLKTICDGLRFPGDQNANPDAETCISIAEGRPFFCLVEDDALIRRINSRSTVLLEDLTDNTGANSRVTVTVVVSSCRFPNYAGNSAPPWLPGIKGLLTPL